MSNTWGVLVLLENIIGKFTYKLGVDADGSTKALREFKKEVIHTGHELHKTDLALHNIFGKTLTNLATKLLGVSAVFGAAGVSAQALGGSVAVLAPGFLKLSELSFGLTAQVGLLTLGISNLSEVIGKNLLATSAQWTEAAMEQETIIFGLKTQMEIYEKTTGPLSHNLDQIVDRMQDLHRVTGISNAILSQGTLIMLEMSRVSGMSADQIFKLIERISDFATSIGQPGAFLDIIDAVNMAFKGIPQHLRSYGIDLGSTGHEVEKFTEELGKSWKGLTKVEKSVVRYRALREILDRFFGKSMQANVETLAGQIKLFHSNLELIAQKLGGKPSESVFMVWYEVLNKFADAILKIPPNVLRAIGEAYRFIGTSLLIFGKALKFAFGFLVVAQLIKFAKYILHLKIPAIFGGIFVSVDRVAKKFPVLGKAAEKTKVKLAGLALQGATLGALIRGVLLKSLTFLYTRFVMLAAVIARMIVPLTAWMTLLYILYKVSLPAIIKLFGMLREAKKEDEKAILRSIGYTKEYTKEIKKESKALSELKDELSIIGSAMEDASKASAGYFTSSFEIMAKSFEVGLKKLSAKYFSAYEELGKKARKATKEGDKYRKGPRNFLLDMLFGPEEYQEKRDKRITKLKVEVIKAGEELKELIKEAEFPLTSKVLATLQPIEDSPEAAARRIEENFRAFELAYHDSVNKIAEERGKLDQELRKGRMSQEEYAKGVMELAKKELDAELMRHKQRVIAYKVDMKAAKISEDERKDFFHRAELWRKEYAQKLINLKYEEISTIGAARKEDAERIMQELKDELEARNDLETKMDERERVRLDRLRATNQISEKVYQEKLGEIQLDALERRKNIIASLLIFEEEKYKILKMDYKDHLKVVKQYGEQLKLIDEEIKNTKLRIDDIIKSHEEQINRELEDLALEHARKMKQITEDEYIHRKKMLAIMRRDEVGLASLRYAQAEKARIQNISIWDSMKEHFEESKDDIKTWRYEYGKAITDMAKQTVLGLGDAFADMTENIKEADNVWKQFAINFLRSLNKMIAQLMAFKLLEWGMGLFPSGDSKVGGGKAPIKVTDLLTPSGIPDSHQAGGYVSKSGLATIHSGEYILNANAVKALGRTSVERANTGGGIEPESGITVINISAVDAPSFQKLLAQEQGLIGRISIDSVMRNYSEKRELNKMLRGRM